MFRHLLVPLDGSRLAEAALPAAACLAQRLDIPVTLIHVIEENAPRAVHGDRHLTASDEAGAYLDQVAERAFPDGVSVERHVHTSAVNDVGRSILAHAEEFGADLIVMCTHGRGGLRTLLFGSIAQQITRLGTTPILLVRPTETGGAPAFSCRRILVPLDGNPEHEQGLKVAAGLAQVCGAELHLVMAVHTVGTLSGQQAATARLLPGTASALLDLSVQEARAYLQDLGTRLLSGRPPATVRVCRGEPSKIIVDTALQLRADLIAMGTHGKAAPDAFWSGSITPRVSGQSHVPLLLVPVQAAA